MRPSKLMIVALTLFFVLLGVPCLVAKDSKERIRAYRPDAGEAYDPGTREGDPWQDDDSGGPKMTGHTSTYVVVSIWSSPFSGLHITLIKRSEPAGGGVKDKTVGVHVAKSGTK